MTTPTTLQVAEAVLEGIAIQDLPWQPRITPELAAALLTELRRLRSQATLAAWGAVQTEISIVLERLLSMPEVKAAETNTAPLFLDPLPKPIEAIDRIAEEP